MNLKKLTKKLEKIYKFYYLTVEPDNLPPKETYTIKIWLEDKKPVYFKRLDEWFGEVDGNEFNRGYYTLVVGKGMKEPIDFFDYLNESGFVDYSKCIVKSKYSK